MVILCGWFLAVGPLRFLWCGPATRNIQRCDRFPSPPCPGRPGDGPDGFPSGNLRQLSTGSCPDLGYVHRLVLKGRTGHLFNLLLILSLTLTSSILGVPAAPAGQVDLPAGGALRAPPARRPMFCRGRRNIQKRRKWIYFCFGLF